MVKVNGACVSSPDLDRQSRWKPRAVLRFAKPSRILLLVITVTFLGFLCASYEAGNNCGGIPGEG